jgi:hypothetical protein
MNTAVATVSGSGVLPSRVNVPRAASPTGQWIANPLCCRATDQCFNGKCCVPPAPAAGPVPTCTSDAQCCPFAVTWRSTILDQQGPVPHLFHQLCMSVSNDAAGPDRTPHARAIFDAYRPQQATGCFARNCGGRGQACCPIVAGLQATACGAGLACDGSDNTCQPRCPNCDQCPLGEECNSGFCRIIPAPRCGQRGQSCCSPGVDPAVASDGCNQGPGQSICQRNLPQHCGDRRPTFACRACGQVGESCCANSTCNSGLRCDNRNTCQVDTRCGNAGQPCCPFFSGAACNSPTTLACVNNQCTSCGGPGQICCGALHSPNSCRTTGGTDYSCNMPTSADASGPLCEACGGLNQACCYSYSATGAVVASCGGILTCQPTGRVGRHTCQRVAP